MRRGTQVLALAVAVALLATAGLAGAVEVGQKAPDFTLPSTMGGTLTLSSFAGKRTVVLFFFLAAFTPT